MSIANLPDAPTAGTAADAAKLKQIRSITELVEDLICRRIKRAINAGRRQVTIDFSLIHVTKMSDEEPQDNPWRLYLPKAVQAAETALLEKGYRIPWDAEFQNILKITW